VAGRGGEIDPALRYAPVLDVQVVEHLEAAAHGRRVSEHDHRLACRVALQQLLEPRHLLLVDVHLHTRDVVRLRQRSRQSTWACSCARRHPPCLVVAQHVASVARGRQAHQHARADVLRPVVLLPHHAAPRCQVFRIGVELEALLRMV